MSIKISLVGLSQAEANAMLREVRDDISKTRSLLSGDGLSGAQFIKCTELKYGLMETERALELHSPEVTDAERARRLKRAVAWAEATLRELGQHDAAERLRVMSE